MTTAISYTVFNKPREFILELMRRNQNIYKKAGVKSILVAPDCDEIKWAQYYFDRILEKASSGFPRDLYERILLAVSTLPDDETVFLVEDDVIYPECHFYNTPQHARWYYNLNVIYISANGYFINYPNAMCLHQSFAHASVIRDYCLRKLNEIDNNTFDNIYEPWLDRGYLIGIVKDPVPSLDIRAGQNFGWADDGTFKYFQNLPYWGTHSRIWQKYGIKSIPVSFVMASKQKTEAIEKNIKDLIGPFADIVIVKNPDNISEAYDQGSKKAKNDLIVFIHDDVVLRWPEDWHEKLKPVFDDPTTGFVGVAGARGLLSVGTWWGYNRTNFDRNDLLLGAVSLGIIEDGKVKEELCIFGDYSEPLYGEAVVMDGLCLITKKHVLEKIGGFSKEIFGKFHYYDIGATFRAFLTGFHNYVAPLPIIHFCEGRIPGKEWNDAKLKFLKKYEDKLPVILKHRSLPTL